MNDRLSAEVNRLVTPEELRDALSSPLGDAEREEALALLRWFTRRYPTAEQRLGYVRHAYSRWRRTVLPSDAADAEPRR